jgi:periplasmic protein TonB
MSPRPSGGFLRARRPVRFSLLLALAALHLAVIYALAVVLVPDLTAAAQRSVVSAFTLSPEPPVETPPLPDPDDSAAGAAGDPGREATPRPVTAPPARIVLPDTAPAPRASSTGTANRSGAASEGDGTGASGSGDGLGSGGAGSGRGSGLASKPVHISGEINNARDYPVPAGGREARRGTEVIVRVIIGTDGRARECVVFRASPDGDADRLTCQLVETRLRFRPATDAAGNPVAAPFFWRQRWF